MQLAAIYYQNKNMFFRFICLVAFFVTTLFAPLFDAHGDSKKRILILHSYHQGNKWTDDENSGILSVIGNNRPGFQIETEYMDTKKIADDRYILQLVGMYSRKYKKTHFNVIITTDDNAFFFLRTYRDRLFPGSPVVFCGVNFFKPSYLTGIKGFTGVNEDADLKGAIDIALHLHPGNNEMVLITDATETGQRISDRFKELIPSYGGRVRFRILDDLEMETIQGIVANLKPGSLVLFTFFFRDRKGRFFEYYESSELITGSATVPVYVAWNYSMGHAVGGLMVNGFDQGRVAGELAQRVLNGDPVDSIPVVMESPNRYIFDYTQMARFGITSSDLPSGSSIMNAPALFYQVNKRTVWLVLMGFIVMTGTVIVLLINIRKRRRAELSLIDEIEVRKQVQVDLQKVRDELEMRVQERTVDLTMVNQHLLAEIAERKRMEEQLRELSERDALTKVFNRRKLLELLMSELRKAERYRRPLSLIIFDLDRFKNVNDTYGHDVGDLVLQMTTGIILTTVRNTDICARYGGEEFIVVAPETNMEGALALAEKIRHSIEQYIYPVVGTVTISAGVAEFRSEDSEDMLIKRADEALYAAKSKGRNRVEIAVSAPQSSSYS
jgi:diguanylate cyclase (GGDEF)-like protein